MTTKRVAISAFTAVILTVVIRVVLRAKGIHNFLSVNSTGGFLIYLVINFSLLFFKRRSAKKDIY